MKMRYRKAGFTLIEMMVATTIAAFISLVSIGALRAVTASAKMVEDNINSAAEVRFAAKTLKRDLFNVYNPKNQGQTKFVALSNESGGITSSYLVFYTVSRTRARAQEPEGDIYEVEYYLMADEEESVLMRRFWPNPDEELEPGGMLSVIAEDIEIFEARYFDGEEWAYEWPEEMQSLPMLIELNIVGKPVGSLKPVSETLYVSLVRSAGSMLDEEGEEGGG